MLGDLLLEERGQTSGVRVLPSEGPGPKVEVSFQASGTVLGIEHTSQVTYHSVPRPDGTMFGEGRGVLMTVDGDMATFIGHGVGRPTGRGMAASWRGALYYQTASPKLARLNDVAVVFEFETDEDGTTDAKAWEWK